MTHTVQEFDPAVPGEDATAIQNAGIAAAGSRSARPGERAGPGTHGDGSSVGALPISADANPEEAAAIVAAITQHLRTEALPAEDDDEAETAEGGLRTVSVRMDLPPQTSVPAADIPTDPWIAAGRMR